MLNFSTLIVIVLIEFVFLSAATSDPNLCDKKGTIQCELHETCCPGKGGTFKCCPYFRGNCCGESSGMCCPPGFRCIDGGNCRRLNITG
ncbi:unnamed protein product, partial [Mesorhabditis belari]|uniref:Granulins domain-containing protein n=1 Tax=Mesorhabditis belari TaxID=2138241 RepID=A0AAF3EIM6_9BILA